MSKSHPPVCDYEGSTYQSTFWDEGGREYEDRVEQIALRRLLPPSGKRMLEVGAGAGRNTLRYEGYKQIVLFDYSRTQLEQAQLRLGRSRRFIYVVGDIYRLPFAPGVFDGATMIRTLHHIAKPVHAFEELRISLVDGSKLILEFANKRNLKAILRWALRMQSWSPIDGEMIEFAPLNFNFHPAHVRSLLVDQGFEIGRQLTVSHFRLNVLKRVMPLSVLSALDALLQPTGNWFQLTPSVFVEAHLPGSDVPDELKFRCPECRSTNLLPENKGLRCESCASLWGSSDGIYDFKTKLPER